MSHSTPLAESPAAAGFDPARLARARQVLAGGLADNAYAGAVALIWRRGAVAAHWAIGNAQRWPDADRRPMRPDTIFDLASVTKVVAGLTAALLLVERGGWALGEPVVEFLPQFERHGKQRVTLRHLLTHTSGLPAWAPLYADARTPAATLDLICDQPLAYEPGSWVEYSDLGFSLLGLLAEQLLNERLDTFLMREVFTPLGMVDTHFRRIGSPTPPANTPARPIDLARYAATEVGNQYEQAMVARLGRTFNDWRERLLIGEVHDGNCAYALEGVSAHAGLFATAADLARFGQFYLEALAGQRGGAIATRTMPRILGPASLEDATFPQTGGLNDTRGLGWSLRHFTGQPLRQLAPPHATANPHGQPTDTRPSPSHLGDLASTWAFGHTGFTGTSLVIDPYRDLVMVLLTNRVHPHANNRRLTHLRPRFHNAVIAAIVD